MKGDIITMLAFLSSSVEKKEEKSFTFSQDQSLKLEDKTFASS